jgi:hypothetical protein
MAIKNEQLNDVGIAFALPPEHQRMQAFSLGHQFNCLYDDIQAGLFGDAAKTGSFCKYIESIKEAYPKA